MFILLIQWEIHTKWRSYTENTKIVSGIVVAPALASISSSSVNIVCHYMCFCKPSLTVCSELTKMPDLHWPRTDRRDYLFRPTIYGSQELIAGTAASFKARCSIYKPECPPTRLSLPPLLFSPLLLVVEQLLLPQSSPSKRATGIPLSTHSLKTHLNSVQHQWLFIFNAKYSAWTLDGLLVIHTPAFNHRCLSISLNFLLHVITEFLELFREIVPHHGQGIDPFFQPRRIVRTSFGLAYRTDCQSGRVATPPKRL